MDLELQEHTIIFFFLNIHKKDLGTFGYMLHKNVHGKKKGLLTSANIET